MIDRRTEKGFVAKLTYFDEPDVFGTRVLGQYERATQEEIAEIVAVEMSSAKARET